MLASTLVVPTRAQDIGGLHFVAALDEYYRVQYVPPPARPALDVVFAGEPVQLRLTVGNRNHTPESLATLGRPIEQAFAVSMIRAPEGASPPMLATRPAGRATADASDVSWGDDIAIPPRGTVTFNASIATSRTTAPGVYELKITPNLQTSSKVNGLGTIVRYEVRLASTSADEIEVMRRQMMREYYRDQPAAAEAAADALLEKYPRSAAAYQIKGLLASTKGNRTEAIEALNKARQLLATGQDELSRTQPANELHRALTDLIANIDAVTKNMPIRVH
jgi:tetratricopeptide (TPR) repeat protein